MGKSISRMTAEEYGTFLRRFIDDIERGGINRIFREAAIPTHPELHTKNDTDSMIRRCETENLRAVSVFFSLEDMVQNVEDVLYVESEGAIGDWMTDSSSKRGIFTIDMRDLVGKGLVRTYDTEKQKVRYEERETDWIRVVLQRDPYSSVGFSVVTAYPEIERKGVPTKTIIEKEPETDIDRINLARETRKREREERKKARPSSIKERAEKVSSRKDLSKEDRQERVSTADGRNNMICDDVRLTRDGLRP